jgi:hypothetical protein
MNVCAHSQTTFNSSAAVRSVSKGVDSSLERDLVDVTHKLFHKKHTEDSSYIRPEH